MVKRRLDLNSDKTLKRKIQEAKKALKELRGGLKYKSLQANALKQEIIIVERIHKLESELNGRPSPTNEEGK